MIDRLAIRALWQPHQNVAVKDPTPEQSGKGYDLRDVFETGKAKAPSGKASPAQEDNTILRQGRHDQFIPDDIIKSGDPAAVRKFITDSNNEAYQGAIGDLNQQIANLVVGAIFHSASKDSQGKLRELEAARDNLVAQRDAQTRTAIGVFDKYLDEATPKNICLADPKPPVQEAAKKYNDNFVFYAESEGQKISGPTTLYAQGKGDAGKIDPNDIKQRGLGDCYYLASVSALAKSHPEAIQNMIQDNKDGTYAVTFHRPGPDGKDEAVKVSVDLTIPSNSLRDDPSGDSSSAGAEVWPQVIEKAYAKFRGAYGNIGAGGWPSDALYTLTGRPAAQQPTAGYSIDQISQDLGAKRALVMDTCGVQESDKQLFKDYHLVENHAYSVKEVKKDKEGHLFLVLSNPWGYNDPKPIPFDVAAKLVPDLYVS
jgi:hypothetical protein